ncbi:glycosyl transferase family 11 domain-containing protein [Ditylenchus destructor]|nr:glycosyl transferase family 11 domain-containing protein [Ditylenchus destructor]
MGQSLGRSPAYVLDDTTMRKNEQEVAALFPTFYGMTHYIPRQNSSARQFQLANTCCDYKDPVVLRNFSEPLLELTVGINFEHYKYFHNERERIREIFNFSQEARRRVQKIASDLYRDNHSHKLCIHVRTGDFKEWHWESKPNATSEAIRRIAKNFTEKGIDYSLVFLGQDKEFFKQVNLNEQQKRNVFVTPKDISRGDEMCLGATTCDSLLITAHISTYGFWIGYLMPDNSRIYYIANYKTSQLHTPGQFPPEWVHFDL